jgi:PAS domain S-box-containing protein
MKDQLQLELERLNTEIEQLHGRLMALQQEKVDLEVILQATTEHSDQILQSLKQQKTDLEILLEATTEHSDSLALELRQIAREERRQREEQFQLITAATPVGLAITQIIDGQFLYANEMFGKILGLSSENLLDRSAPEFYADPSDRQQVLSALSQEQQFQGEVLFKRADGTPFWALLSLRPFRFQGENAILTVLYDITDRKQAEQALQRAEQKYRSIFENALEGIYQSTPDGQYISVNPALARMMGYASSEEMLNTAHDISREYVDETGREAFKQLIEAQGSVTGFERQSYRRDGGIIWVSESARAVQDEFGKLLYYEGIIEDITQRKQAQAALQLAEAKYRGIFENAVEGIFRSSPDGHYVEVNPAMAALYGFDSPQAMCQEITHISQQIYVNSEDRDRFKHLIEKQGEIKDFEYQVYRRDRTIFWISEWARAIRDTQGRLLYYEGSCVDITKRKQEEEALKQQLRELQIEIDQNKRTREVAAIVETDYFQQLQEEVERLRFFEDEE